MFAATTERDRADRLEAYVRARVGQVSEGTVDASATTALKELGLDSLMLVRLRNAFARELGAELRPPPCSPPPTSAAWPGRSARCCPNGTPPRRPGNGGRRPGGRGRRRGA
ncbi:acyl carrier protein [Streptomyces mirabilis]|nr:acyl carrier protein [Streptomyces mirabilis]